MTLRLLFFVFLFLLQDGLFVIFLFLQRLRRQSYAKSQCIHRLLSQEQQLRALVDESRADPTARRQMQSQIQGLSEREERLTKEVEEHRRLAEVAVEDRKKAEEEVARLRKEVENASSRARAEVRAVEGRYALAGERIAQLEEEKRLEGEAHTRAIVGFQDGLTKATRALEQARRDWSVLASEANLVREQRDALGREVNVGIY